MAQKLYQYGEDTSEISYTSLRRELIASRLDIDKRCLMKFYRVHLQGRTGE